MKYNKKKKQKTKQANNEVIYLTTHDRILKSY